MSLPKQESKHLTLNNDDVLKYLADGIRKNHPELAEEEFEVVLAYDGYDYTYRATVEHY